VAAPHYAPRIVPLAVVFDLPDGVALTEIVATAVDAAAGLAFPAAAIGLIPRSDQALRQAAVVVGLHIGDDPVASDDAAGAFYQAARYAVLTRYAIDSEGVGGVRVGAHGISVEAFRQLRGIGLPEQRGRDRHGLLPPVSLR